MPKDMLIAILLAVTVLVSILFFINNVVSIFDHFKKRLNPKLIKISFSIAAVLLLTFFVTDQLSANTSFFCKGCHKVTNEYKSWQKSSHKNNSCLSCHQKPGIVGSLNSKVNAFNNFLSWVTFSNQKQHSDISNEVCNNCHKKSEIDYSKNIKIRHEDFVNSYKCSFCHSQTGHLVPKRANVSVMFECFKCHNNKSESLNCSFCHVKKKKQKEIIKLTFHKDHSLANPSTCKGCHQKQFCIKCHKVEIPHPVWFGLEHSRRASEDDNCSSCHRKRFCDSCHKLKMPHPVNYVAIHMKDTTKKGKKLCLTCHLTNDCMLACHERHVHPGKIREMWRK